MISQKRILASRSNGALSRGPKTPEGKARSRNAVRSRRLTDGVVLGQESREAFQELFNFHVDGFSPVDDVEMGMVEEMASAYWRIRRNWAIEKSLIESATAAQPEGPELPRIAAAVFELAAAPGLESLRRYETRLHVIYQRALHNLLILRSVKNQAEPSKSRVLSIANSCDEPDEPNEPEAA
jgi:hypothetical protein